MTAAAILESKICYSGSNGSASWIGRRVDNADVFRRYVKERVRARVDDDEAGDPFAAELRGMATTGMATEFVERLLRAVPEDKSWEIGEALAECVLTDDDSREVCWPWNLVRDRRTPRASLPGADLVGFCRQGETVLLLFGEVKTSSDSRTPPNVMNGSGGMTWQLAEEATRLDVQHVLLKWLRARCNSQQHLGLYHAAVERYVQSQGKDILLVGILLRDTQADERDVKSRSTALSEKLTCPTRIEITAWYLPVPISNWPKLLREEAS
jgi:hypothetical protein